MIEEAFLRDMERNGLRATRSFSFKSYKIDDETNDPNAHPVTVELTKGPTSEGGSDGGDVVSVRCKYLVGCDGGRSAVRHFGIEKHGLSFDGELLSTLWGAGDFGERSTSLCFQAAVADPFVTSLVVKTDFPDIRKIAAIHSAR